MIDVMCESAKLFSGDLPVLCRFAQSAHTLEVNILRFIWNY